MTKHADTRTRIALNGDWSIIGITYRLHELSNHLKTFSINGKSTASLNLEFCVSGVETIDASGCQLLALFLRHLRQKGFTTTIVNPPDQFRSIVTMLGFGTELEVTEG